MDSGKSCTQSVTELTEKSRCPKCGTRTLERDGTDLHCWTCGHIIYYVYPETMPMAELVKDAKPPSVAVAPSRNAGSELQTRVMNKTASCNQQHLKVGVLESASMLEPTVNSRVIAKRYRGRLGVTKVGHYGKTESKIAEVVCLYNDGQGIRFIESQLGLAKNTVRNILQENARDIDLELATRRRKDRVKRTKQTIIPALKGIASSAKANNYSYEVMFSHTEEILASYIKLNPVETIKSLIGDNSFTVDDVIKKAYEVVLGQRLRLEDEFVEVEPGIFQLKNT